MVKLVAAFNTKYFHAVFASRIAKFIDEHPGETIDLAGAKLTAHCARVVNSAMADRRVIFVDSEDPERQHILDHDQSLISKKASFPTTTTLPVPRSKEHMQQILAIDYTGKLLAVQNTAVNTCMWLIIFIARHPEYDYEMPTLQSKTLFKLINQYYNKRSYVGRPVYYIRDNDAGVDVNENPDLGFCNSHVCVPTEFGTKNLFALPEWKQPLTAMLGDFSNTLGHYGRTISDVLKGG